jgi:hypothetical protein
MERKNRVSMLMGDADGVLLSQLDISGGSFGSSSGVGGSA